jgi:hypothetical protein
MTIGTSIFVIALGAILSFVGLSFMICGVVGLVITLFFLGSTRRGR